MDKFTVKITDEAVADMDALYQHIATELRAPENALGQYNRIAEAILSLDQFPERFAIFDTEPEKSMGIHKMVVDNYLVCYIIDFKIVTILAVMYGATDIKSRLWNRLL